VRRLGLWIAVAACSPAPPERLHTPKPLPGRCKTSEQISQIEQPILAANKPRDDAAAAKFLAERQLTLDGSKLPMMIAGKPRWTGAANEQLPDAQAVQSAIFDAHHREHDLFRVDLGRATWSQVIVDPNTEDPCARDPLPATTYALAHDASGTAVVIRTRTSRHIATSVEQCGTCFIGCGIPVDGYPWVAVLLPIAAGVPSRIETLDLVEDRVQVWCEEEKPAM
jgi:hypothetical protein